MPKFELVSPRWMLNLFVVFVVVVVVVVVVVAVVVVGGGAAASRHVVLFLFSNGNFADLRKTTVERFQVFPVSLFVANKLTMDGLFSDLPKVCEAASCCKMCFYLLFPEQVMPFSLFPIAFARLVIKC